MVVPEVLKAKLLTIFDTMASDEDKAKDTAWLAGELATAISDQIKTAGVPSGQVIVAVVGQATGTPNPNPINVQ